MLGLILPLDLRELTAEVAIRRITSFCTPTVANRLKYPAEVGTKAFTESSKLIVLLNRSPTTPYPILPEGWSRNVSCALVTSAVVVGI